MAREVELVQQLADCFVRTCSKTLQVAVDLVVVLAVAVVVVVVVIKRM
jgi:hypothetical protein